MSLLPLMLDSLEGRPEAWSLVSVGLRDAIADYARRSSPYYAHAAPRGLAFEDWPLLTRSVLREELDDIVVPDSPPETRFEGSTSGSTGEPTRYVLDTLGGQAAFAGLAALRHWHGLSETRVTRVVSSTARPLATPPDWSVLSTHGLTPETVAEFIESWSELGDYFLYIRASAIAWIAGEVETQGIPIANRPRAVVTTMDALTDEERRRVARVLGCPVHSWYGMREICGYVAGTLPDGRRYAFNPLLTYPEILDDEGRPVPVGETGRIVLTDLHNRVAPMIRYDTGDVAEASGEHLGAWPVIERLRGRQSELLRLDNGRMLGAEELGHFLFVRNDFEREIGSYQVLQRAAGDLELRVVWRSPVGPEVAEGVVEVVQPLVGEDMKLTLVPVDELETLPSGKRWIVRSEVS